MGTSAATGGGSGIHDVGELFPRDLQSVGDRTHRVSDDQRVGIIVEEDREPGEPGRNFATPAGAREGAHRIDDSLSATVPRHNADQATEQERKHDDLCVSSLDVTQGWDYIRVYRAPESGQRIVAGDGEGPEPDTSQECRDDFSKEKRQGDREHRWGQREPAGCEGPRDLL